jgi:hypothetical protein
MEGSVVLDIEEQETENKDPIIKEGRITESFEIQMDEIDKEVERKLEEISKKKCEQCNDPTDDIKYYTQCVCVFGIFIIIMYFFIQNIRNN